MILKSSIINNVIFDLGGVIMNLRFDRMLQAFQKLGIFINFEADYIHNNQKIFIEDFETGKMTPRQFRDYLRQNTHNEITDAQIDAALNAILSDVPTSRIEFLQQLKKHYRIFLFSNTNQINEDCYHPALKQKFGFDIFTDLFEESFMSHHIGYRKPSIEAFQYILQKRGLKPEETVFIDDLLSNIEGARNAGIHAIQLKEGMEINELFNDKFEIIF
ncbi:MAG: HAD family phosphatase [Bacteroidales bacterium]|nr:HAD family phosphatase [Bacteroidales bacterium]